MRIVIVGGVAGGASAAARARRLDENANIVLIERGNYVSFANCGLPYYVGDEIQQRDKLIVTQPQRLRDRFRIDVRTRSNAINIPVDVLRDRLHELPKDRPIVTYCQVGQRGYIATRILLQNGMRVRNLSGGYKTF